MPHCFIVDDSDIVRKYTRLIFESLHYRVSEAASAEKLIERFETDTPDFIIMDWRIPGADPIQVISQIRKARLDRRPFILYYPAENDPADIGRALAAGADDFLLKPINKEIVEMKLREIKFAA